MTVIELRQALSQFPDNHPVLIFDPKCARLDDVVSVNPNGMTCQLTMHDGVDSRWEANNETDQPGVQA